MPRPDPGKTMKKQEWQLSIIETGEIFVQHFTLPRFTVQIIIKSGQPEPCVSFKAKWDDAKQRELHWYLRALEFYNNAPIPPTDS